MERWTKATVYDDMWVDPGEDPRETEVELGDERSTLTEYLRRYRLTLEMKCADLTPEQLALRSVPPSTMSLLGLVRHLAEVERGWFRRGLAGEDADRLYATAENRDADFDEAVGRPEEVAAAWDAWHAEVVFADSFTRTHELDFVGPAGRPLRDILVHMIEEYARHCGHADLLRECIDGRVGQ